MMWSNREHSPCRRGVHIRHMLPIWHRQLCIPTHSSRPLRCPISVHRMAEMDSEEHEMEQRTHFPVTSSLPFVFSAPSFTPSFVSSSPSAEFEPSPGSTSWSPSILACASSFTDVFFADAGVTAIGTPAAAAALFLRYLFTWVAEKISLEQSVLRPTDSLVGTRRTLSFHFLALPIPQCVSKAAPDITAPFSVVYIHIRSELSFKREWVLTTIIVRRFRRPNMGVWPHLTSTCVSRTLSIRTSGDFFRAGSRTSTSSPAPSRSAGAEGLRLIIVVNASGLNVPT